MVRQAIDYTPLFFEYVRSVSVRQPEIFERLRAETAKLPSGSMMVAPEQGQFLGLMVKLIGARRAIEIGTFTGYSSLWLADALPEDGRLICFEKESEFAAIGEPYWREAGVDHKIDLRIERALPVLDSLIADGAGGTFDFIFVDADKKNYLNYYERALELVRAGGLIVFDNVFWGGEVADPTKTGTVEFLRELNAKLHADERVDISMVPLGDGLTLARKR